MDHPPPEGHLGNTWTGQDMKGGRFVECDAPMDTIPVYCAGAGWAAMGPAFNALDGQKPGRRAAATGNLPARRVRMSTVAVDRVPSWTEDPRAHLTCEAPRSPSALDLAEGVCLRPNKSPA